MNYTLRIASALATFALVTACSGGGGGIMSQLPQTTSTNPTTVGKLQMALGYATLARPFAAVSVPAGTPQQTGNTETVLNVVATYRQANGLSGTLYNLPQLMGPSNFKSHELNGPPNGYTTCPPGGLEPKSLSTDPNGGSLCYDHLNYSPSFAVSDIFQYSPVGLFAYGFSGELSPDPVAYGNGNAQRGPDFTNWNGVLISQSVGDVFSPQAYKFYGGAPLFPFTNNGQYPNGFQGYPAGFAIFEGTPVAGPYTLTLGFPVQSQSGGVQPLPTYSSAPFIIPSSMPQVSTTATFTAHAPLPEMPQPAIALDGNGGGTITVTVPKGVTETWVFVNATGLCYPFATKPWADHNFTLRTTQTGTVTLFLPDDLGPQINGTTTHTICTAADNTKAGTSPTNSGDGYSVTAVGFDYPAFAAAPPANTQQLPTISNAQGFADVTISSPNVGVSP